MKDSKSIDEDTLKLFIETYILKNDKISYNLEKIDNFKNNKSVQEYKMICEKKINFEEAKRNSDKKAKELNIEIEQVEYSNAIIFESSRDEIYLEMYFQKECNALGTKKIKKIDKFCFIEFIEKKFLEIVLNKTNKQDDVVKDLKEFSGNEQAFEIFIKKNKEINTNQRPYSFIFKNERPKQEFNELIKLNKVNLIDEGDKKILEYFSLNSVAPAFLSDYEKQFNFFERTIKKEQIKAVELILKKYDKSVLDYSNTIVNNLHELKIEGYDKEVKQAQYEIESIIKKSEINRSKLYKINKALGKFLSTFKENIVEIFEVDDVKDDDDEIYENNETCSLTIFSLNDNTANEVKKTIDSSLQVFHFPIDESCLFLFDRCIECLDNKYLNCEKTLKYIYFKSKEKKKIVFVGEKSCVIDFEKFVRDFFAKNKISEENCSSSFDNEKLYFLNCFKKRELYDECVNFYKENGTFVSAYIEKTKSDHIELIITGTEDARNCFKKRIELSFKKLLIEKLVCKNNKSIDLNRLEKETNCAIFPIMILNGNFNLRDDSISFKLISYKQDNIKKCKDKLFQ